MKITEKALKNIIKEEVLRIKTIKEIKEKINTIDSELKILKEFHQEEILDTEDYCFIEDKPSGGYDISCGSEFVGNFESIEKSLEIINNWMEKNKYYPTIMFVSDHGNHWPIDREGNEIKTHQTEEQKNIEEVEMDETRCMSQTCAHRADSRGEESVPQKYFYKGRIEEEEDIEGPMPKKYENVVFLQGDEAEEPLHLLGKDGEDVVLEYLKQWHNPGQHEVNNELGAGSSDKTYKKDGYIMTWNSNIGYIGLEKEIDALEEGVGLSSTNKCGMNAPDQREKC